MSFLPRLLTAAALVLALAPCANADAKGQRIELSVTSKGFEPTPVKVKKGEPVTLVVTRKTDRTCAKELVLKEHAINQKLPLNEAVTINFTPTKSGELKYGCAMGQMISGILLVE